MADRPVRGPQQQAGEWQPQPTLLFPDAIPLAERTLEIAGQVL